MRLLPLVVFALSLAYGSSALAATGMQPGYLGAGISLDMARLKFGGGMKTGQHAGPVFNAGVEFINFSHDHLLWTVAEVEGGISLGGQPRLEYGALGSRIGYPFPLDGGGQHQLRVGLSLHWGTTTRGSNSGLLLSPFVRYFWDIFGVELQAIVPTFPAANGEYPVIFLANAVTSMFWLR